LNPENKEKKFFIIQKEKFKTNGIMADEFSEKDNKVREN
jgi:hypothetical protein